LAWGALALGVYPFFLLFSGDPTVREAASLVRRIIGRFRRFGLK
jgi:hypothetical protein